MVVGKGGDTVAIANLPISKIPASAHDALLKSENFDDGSIHYKTDSLKEKVKIYRIQSTDGVIGTSDTAVKICLGLIGIMTLFMGFIHQLLERRQITKI